MGPNVSPSVKVNIYCDEAATSDQYTVIGCLHMRQHIVEQVNNKIEAIVESHGGTSELKWNKIRSGNMSLYLNVFDLLFKQMSLGFFHYRALVIDNSRMRNDYYNGGDKELGFNKMLFQALHQHSRLYKEYSPTFHAYLDNRTTKHTPDQMKMMLNKKARSEYGLIEPFSVCQFRDSKKVRLIQATDILTGAIAYKTNGKDSKATAGNHRPEIIREVTKMSGMTSLANATAYNSPHNRHFNIWHFLHQ